MKIRREACSPPTYAYERSAGSNPSGACFHDELRFIYTANPGLMIKIDLPLVSRVIACPSVKKAVPLIWHTIQSPLLPSVQIYDFL